MRISEDRLQLMFKFAGIKKSILHNALLQMGRKHLKSKLFKDNWSEDNPTKNYCYVIAEFVYYYHYNIFNTFTEVSFFIFICWFDWIVKTNCMENMP